MFSEKKLSETLSVRARARSNEDAKRSCVFPIARLNHTSRDAFLRAKRRRRRPKSRSKKAKKTKKKDKDDKRPVTSDALGGAADETAQGGASDDVAVITFNTHWLGSFALLQAVSSNLPYRSWRIYPQLMTQADSSGLPATGADDPGAVAIAFEVDLPWTTIHMRVTAEGCMLARPIQTPGQDLHQCTTARHLTALVGQSQPAGVLLGRLREAGLLLSPTDALAPLVSCATKDRAMQADVASGVSMIAAGYHISSAALNKQLSHTSASIMIEFQCQQGCNAPPPKTGGRPVTSKSTKSAKSDKSVGADAEGG